MENNAENNFQTRAAVQTAKNDLQMLLEVSRIEECLFEMAGRDLFLKMPENANGRLQFLRDLADQLEALTD